MGKLPEWPIDPLENFMEKAKHLARIVDLSIGGIKVTTTLPKAIKALDNYHKSIGTDVDEQRSLDMQEQSDFAQDEVNRNFPIIYGQAVVSLWSLLELCVKDVVATWIKNDQEVLLKDPFLNMKIKLGEYLALNEDDRNIFLVDLLEKEVSSGIKNGINRFETLLKAVEMSGRTPANMNNIFFEFGQIRNALAHRGDRVDLRLSTACPWLDLEVGSELKVNERMYGKYLQASFSYVTILIARSGMRHDVNFDETLRSIFDSYGEVWKGN